MNIRLLFVCIILFFDFACCSMEEKQDDSQWETIFVHRLNGSPEDLQLFKDRGFIQGEARSFNLPNGKFSSLGQVEEITTLNDQIDPQKTTCLYTQSRGGCTAINLLGKHNPPNVKMLIIDATPADMVNMVDPQLCGIFSCLPRSLKERLLRRHHPNYPKNSLPPVQAIANIENKGLPVFIVHSHNDAKVSIQHAYKNYKAFKEANFPNVYLCELQKGKHIHNSDGEDSHIYRTALHSVYKKHGQQYDPEQATLQDTDLQKLQPSIAEINNKIKAKQSCLRRGCIALSSCCKSRNRTNNGACTSNIQRDYVIIDVSEQDTTK